MPAPFSSIRPPRSPHLALRFALSGLRRGRTVRCPETRLGSPYHPFILNDLGCRIGSSQRLGAEVQGAPRRVLNSRPLAERAFNEARKNAAAPAEQKPNNRTCTASALVSDTGLLGKGQKTRTNRSGASQKYTPISHLRPPKIRFPP